MRELPRDPECWPEPWRGRYLERAAILEVDGGLDRNRAEYLATAALRSEWFRLDLAERRQTFVRRPRPTNTRTAATAPN